MTPTEHFKKAEDCLYYEASHQLEPGDRDAVLRIAQVHATLATVRTTDQITLPLMPPPEHIEPLPGSNGDRRPHSRACGPFCQGHGTACSTNCPTCGGRADESTWKS